MRTLRLARVAAEAEGILLRRRLRSILIRAALAAAAVMFLMGAVAMLHLYAWVRLRPEWGPAATALAMAGFDAAVAIIIALLAARTPKDKVMTDAAAVRDQAMREMRSAFSVASMLRPLLSILIEQWLARRGRNKE